MDLIGFDASKSLFCHTTSGWWKLIPAHAPMPAPTPKLCDVGRLYLPNKRIAEVRVDEEDLAIVFASGDLILVFCEYYPAAERSEIVYRPNTVEELNEWRDELLEMHMVRC